MISLGNDDEKSSQKATSRSKLTRRSSAIMKGKQMVKIVLWSKIDVNHDGFVLSEDFLPKIDEFKEDFEKLVDVEKMREHIIKELKRRMITTEIFKTLLKQFEADEDSKIQSNTISEANHLS